MKRNLLLTIIASFFLFFIVKAQSNPSTQNSNTYTFWNADMQTIAKPESREGWVKFKTNLTTPVQQILDVHKNAFGLSSNDSMYLVKNWTTNNGEHFKYQQFYKGIKVKGAQYILHKTINNDMSGNGKLSRGLNINVSPLINSDSAKTISKTQAYINSSEIFNAKNSKLIIYQRAGNFLAYEVVVQNNEHEDTYYINANTGDVISFHDNHTHSVETKRTTYNGLQQVELSYPLLGSFYDTIILVSGYEIDSINPPGFLLIDSTRGDGIFVKNYVYGKLGGMNGNFAYQFFDAFTHSSESSLYNIDGAIQGLWATQVFYDFLQEKFNMNSLNDLGIKLNIQINRYTNTNPLCI